MIGERKEAAKVYFTELGETEFVHVLHTNILVPHAELYRLVGEVVSKPIDEFKLLDAGRGYRELCSGKLDCLTRLKVQACEKGGKKHVVPIFKFTGDRDSSADFLFDMDVHEDISIPELKSRIAAKLNAAAAETETAEATAVASLQGMPADGSRMRIRELGYGVFMDSQTVIEAVRNFAGTEKFAISLLDGPETKIR